ncbi:MAG: hypothetical protein IJL66_03835, partial [Lachnospiraceae bacterium]|nr:hypothetical protein [Lachnospiraceae bacterium]
MKKRLVALILVTALVMSLLAGCGGGGNTPSTTSAPKTTQSGGETKAPETKAPETEPAPALEGIDAIIAEAEGMTLEELAKKAIEESNGKMFYGVGNSSRGKSAFPLFIEYLKTIDANYNIEFEWQQPKNNKIFDQLNADNKKEVGTFAMTLIQDGNQIQTKMVDPGILDT